MNKTHAIVLTSAMAASYAAGSYAPNPLVDVARAGKAVSHVEEIETTVAAGALAGLSNLQVANGLCDEAESQLGLSDGDCTLGHIREWTVYLFVPGYRDANGDGLNDWDTNEDGIRDTVRVTAEIQRSMLLVDAE